MTTAETYTAIADKLEVIITNIKAFDLTKPPEEILAEFKTKMPNMQQELENISGELKELIEAEAVEIVLRSKMEPPVSVTKEKDYRDVEFYVAYSIHGSNCFITANKTIPVMNNVTLERDQEIIIDHLQFTITRSRVGTSLRNATKLLWSELNDSDNIPSTDPRHIDEKFEQLRALGWRIDNKQFRAKFFPPKPPSKPPINKPASTRKAASKRAAR